MLAQRLELLTAVRANPNADTPRVAFADWLDLQGDSDFARYIRLELERDRLPKADPRREVLQEQIRALPKKKDWDSARISVQTNRGLPFFIEAGLLSFRDAIDRIGPTPSSRSSYFMAAINRISKPRRNWLVVGLTGSESRSGKSSPPSAGYESCGGRVVKIHCSRRLPSTLCSTRSIWNVWKA